jgi:hypothetical protein
MVRTPLKNPAADGGDVRRQHGRSYSSPDFLSECGPIFAIDSSEDFAVDFSGAVVHATIGGFI